jgi:hypothetical protein
VQVVWQQNESIDLEWPSMAAISEDFAEILSGRFLAKNLGTLFGDNGKKEGSSRDEGTSVVGHGFWQ